MDKILVCGLGRCGSSVVMQMFAAAGLRVPGKYPTFEMLPTGDDDWIDDFDVIKWLGPGVTWWPPKQHRYRCIWVERGEKQQAKSRIKYMRAADMLDPRVSDREALDTVRKLMKRDHARGLAVVRRLSTVEPLRVSFESVLASPRREAWRIARWSGRDLRQDAMAAVVVSRDPKCLPGFLESTLADVNMEGPAAPLNPHADEMLRTLATIRER